MFSCFIFSLWQANLEVFAVGVMGRWCLLTWMLTPRQTCMSNDPRPPPPFCLCPSLILLGPEDQLVLGLRVNFSY